jgi:hypothetical protein
MRKLRKFSSAIKLLVLFLAKWEKKNYSNGLVPLQACSWRRSAFTSGQWATPGFCRGKLGLVQLQKFFYKMSL